MPTYTLVPEEHDYEPEELIAESPKALLGGVYDAGWNRARVLQDGRYIFTLSRDVSGAWAILPGLPEADGQE